MEGAAKKGNMPYVIIPPPFSLCYCPTVGNRLRFQHCIQSIKVPPPRLPTLHNLYPSIVEIFQRGFYVDTCSAVPVSLFNGECDSKS